MTKCPKMFRHVNGLDVVYVMVKFRGDTVPANCRVLKTYTVKRS